MRFLVTGAAGMLGRALMNELAAGHEVVGVDLPDGDLTLPATAAALIARHRPDHVLHAAAYTDVDRAESEPDLARAVNADATDRIARACAEAGVGLTCVSTDYVFDGADPAGYAEDAPRRPLGVYGRTKAEGEQAVEAAGGDWRIARTSWLFGPGPKNFVLTVRRLLGMRERLTVVDDQTGCPTYAPDLARALCELAERGATGIFHVTNRGATTWFELARETARLLGADPGRIEPCTTDRYPTPARRPACSILRSTRLEAAGVAPRPPWQDAVGRYIAWLEQQSDPDPGAPR